jgi:hypothetical protein
MTERDAREEDGFGGSYADIERAGQHGVDQYLTGFNSEVDNNIKIAFIKCMELLESDTITQQDMHTILSTAQNTLHFETLNSLAYILGYLVSSGGGRNLGYVKLDPESSEKQKVANQRRISIIKDFIRTNQNISEGVSQEDIIKYGRYWNSHRAE